MRAEESVEAFDEVVETVTGSDGGGVETWTGVGDFDVNSIAVGGCGDGDFTVAFLEE